MFIFISYSSKDRSIVEKLASELIQQGRTVWYDQNLVGGQKWWDIILGNIRACDVFLFALSKNSAESKPCRAELKYATQLNRHVIPLRLDDIDVNLAGLDLDLTQTIDYNPSNRKSVDKVENALSRSPVGISLPLPLPKEPKVPRYPLAEIATQIEEDEISRSQQVAIFTQLIENLKNPKTADSAVILLQKLRKHPDLLARYSDEIDRILSQNDHSLKGEKLSLSELTLANKSLHQYIAPESIRSEEQFGNPSVALKNESVSHTVSKLKQQKLSEDPQTVSERRKRVLSYARCLSQIETIDYQRLLRELFGTHRVQNAEPLDVALKFDDDPALIFQAIEFTDNHLPKVAECLRVLTYTTTELYDKAV